MKRPLILSPRWDLHSASVVWGLMQNGIQPIWTSTLKDPQTAPLSFSIGPDSPHAVDGRLDLSQVSSVWNRRPRIPQEFPEARPCDEPFLRHEWARFQRNVYALSAGSGDQLWVNPPASALAAENKLLQLEMARQCGLLFPETLVSNDPAEIRKFVRKHGRVVYKSFGQRTWYQPAAGKMFSLWVEAIDSDTPLDDAALALCPGIYQPYIPKSREYRVTVIGGRMYTVAIRSSAGDARADWREQALSKQVGTEACELPQGIELAIAALMRKLDIVFGCVDLVVGTGGDTYFLEVNQCGEFLIAEEMAGSLPVLRAMCAMLASGRTDYSLSSISSIWHRDYLATGAFQEWDAKIREEMSAIIFESD